MGTVSRIGRTGGMGRMRGGGAWILIAAAASAAFAVMSGARSFRIVAQQNQNAVAPFVKMSAPVIALTHARVIDGTGAAAREDQTLVIRGGNIAELGVISGDPSKTIADVRRVDTVFKRGVGYDPEKLVESVKGQAGIW